MSIGKVFGYMENKKVENNILNYSVKQTSIEQIFNAFANKALKVKTAAEEEALEVAIPVSGKKEENDEGKVDSNHHNSPN